MISAALSRPVLRTAVRARPAVRFASHRSYESSFAPGIAPGNGNDQIRRMTRTASFFFPAFFGFFSASLVYKKIVDWTGGP